MVIQGRRLLARLKGQHRFLLPLKGRRPIARAGRNKQEGHTLAVHVHKHALKARQLSHHRLLRGLNQPAEGTSPFPLKKLTFRQRPSQAYKPQHHRCISPSSISTTNLIPTVQLLHFWTSGHPGDRCQESSSTKPSEIYSRKNTAETLKHFETLKTNLMGTFTSGKKTIKSTDSKHHKCIHNSLDYKGSNRTCFPKPCFPIQTEKSYSGILGFRLLS